MKKLEHPATFCDKVEDVLHLLDLGCPGRSSDSSEVFTSPASIESCLRSEEICGSPLRLNEDIPSFK